MPDPITQEESNLITNVEAAVRATTRREAGILRNGRVEKTFTSCLANEIAAKIGTDQIRCDPFYNRHLGATKLLDGKRIELDVAVHQRDVDTNNLVAIELETANHPSRDDVWKVERLTHKLGGFGYKLGLYIVFGISQRAGQLIELRWFKDGEALPDLENGLQPGVSLL